MNILTDTLPATIDGYRIETDYRTCLKIILAFEDDELTPQEKIMVLLGNLFLDIPGDTQYALQKAIWFLNGGGENSEDDDTHHYRLYSFEKDANFIYAAFKQTHDIDLQKTQLHWWQFMALFLDLGSETTFCQLTSLRKRLKTGKATKEERTAAREMGGMIDLPEVDDRTFQEKEAEAEFMRLIGK